MLALTIVAACKGSSSGAGEGSPTPSATTVTSASAAAAAPSPHAPMVVTEIAVGQKNPGDLIIDMSNVYWENAGDGTVMSLAKTGGDPVRLAQFDGAPTRLVMAAPDLFCNPWLIPGKGKVLRIPMAGGAPTTILSETNAPDLAATADALFVANDSGAVVKTSRQGGQSTIVTGQPGITAIAVDEGSVYWLASKPTGALIKVALAGGAPSTLATGFDDPRFLATDAANVYWTAGGNVMKVPKAGGTPVALASGQTSPTRLVLDDTTVYWADPEAGSIMKVAKDGGSAVVVASEQPNPAGIAVDEAALYWTNFKSGAVATLAKTATGVVGAPTAAPDPAAAKRLEKEATDYDIGDGVPVDEARAATLFIKACSLGNMRSCNRVAVMHHSQLGGLTKDPALELRLTKLACGGGFAAACGNLGLRYYLGGADQGTPQDRTKALEVFDKACKLGQDDSCKFAAKVRTELGK